jgi:hypothetical protein
MPATLMVNSLFWGCGTSLLKQARQFLSTFKELLQDMEDVSTEASSESSKRLLLNIVATMSDRAGTQIKFNELLQEYRQSTIDDHVHLLSDAEQSSISSLLNFFCGLHALVQQCSYC